MSIAGSALIAIVHDDDGRLVLGHDARHVGIALQAPHIIDDRRARSSAQAATAALSVSIDTGTPSATTSDNIGAEPRAFLLERYANRTAIGPRRFRTDIENIGAFRGETTGLDDGSLTDRDSGRRRKMNSA